MVVPMRLAKRTWRGVLMGGVAVACAVGRLGMVSLQCVLRMRRVSRGIDEFYTVRDSAGRAGGSLDCGAGRLPRCVTGPGRNYGWAGDFFGFDGVTSAVDQFQTSD